MTLKSREVDHLLLILTVVFGLFVRIYPVARSNFPLVDGGMFYAMIHDLQAAHFSLPVFMSYNHQHIPFAYPPLALYLSGALNSLTGIPLLKLIQWQPLLVNVLTIPVVYLFAKRFTGSSTKAWFASFIFALTPNSYWWQIVGGGLTRSLGALFAFSFVYFAYRIFHDQDAGWFALLGATLSGACVVLSHLEWALQAVFSGLLFLLLWGRNWPSVRKALLISGSVLILTAPWWVSVGLHTGLSTFLTASTATDSRLLFFLPLFSFQYTGEYTAFIAVFALIGAILAVAKREYFLLVWALGCLLVDPRGGLPFVVLPLTFVALLSITDLIAPTLLKIAGRRVAPWWNFVDLPVGKLFVGVFAVLCLSHAYEMSNVISLQHLSREEQQALVWVEANTNYTDKFLVLGWESNPVHSALTEWFPALAKRQSLTTVQGQEWFGSYHQAIRDYGLYQQCLSQDLACLQAVGKNNSTHPDCILISFENSGQTPEYNSLYLSLRQSTQFSRVFSSPKVNVFCQ